MFYLRVKQHIGQRGCWKSRTGKGITLAEDLRCESSVAVISGKRRGTSTAMICHGLSEVQTRCCNSVYDSD